MIVSKLIITNYKIFEYARIPMNRDVNIFVGDNDSGKSTILEALSMVLTGKVNGVPIQGRLTLDWFNWRVRRDYIARVSRGETPSPPQIEIEAFLGDIGNNPQLASFRGANNSLVEDSVGIGLRISFDTSYCDAYRELLTNGKIKDIPIEYYHITYSSFKKTETYAYVTAKEVAYIDATRKDYGRVLNRFVAGSIGEYLTESDITTLRHAYRANRQEFTNNASVVALNEKLKENQTYPGKTISLNLREGEVDEWRSDMAISLDGIPLSNEGLGTQNMFKTEMFLREKSDVSVLIVEEPENNLSYANMAILISRLEKSEGKQIFIATHSSYVANKLGLQHLQLVSNENVTSFSGIKEKTYNYFIKLPGYNTLRVILAPRPLLVEGPADELIIQRAYLDSYGKLPIEDGIDVISVGGVTFVNYCEIAALIGKRLVVVTDNDHYPSKVLEKYALFEDIVTVCVEEDSKLHTLEPSVLNANIGSFEDFRNIVYKGSNIKKIDEEALLGFMTKNKTDWCLRVFSSETPIQYPDYILKAIDLKNWEKPKDEQ